MLPIKLFWTLLTHEVAWIWSEITISKEVYYVALEYLFRNEFTSDIYEWNQPACTKCHRQFLNAISLHAQNVIISKCGQPACTKCHRQYISAFTPLPFNIPISVSNSYLPSHPIYDQMFPYTHLDYIFTSIQILIWIVFCFLLYVSIVNVLWRWYGVII